MLDREFRLRQPQECKACYVTLPYRVDEPDGGPANWEIQVHPKCAHGCAEVLEELARKYSDLYDLAPGGGA